MLVAAGISIGSVVISHEPSQQQALVSYLQSGAKVTQFQATESGQLAYVSKPGSDRVYLVGADLAKPPPGHEYQLWTISGKTPAPGPTFVPSGGKVLLQMSADLSQSQIMAVTLEPAGGSKAPTTTPIFTAPIQQQVSTS
jgi:anti-sigma-K factor RskA